MRALAASDYRLPADRKRRRSARSARPTRQAARPALGGALPRPRLNTAAEAEASAQIFANVLRDSLGGTRAATDLLLPAAPLGQLFPEQAARFIAARGGTLHLSTRVGAIDGSLTIAGESFDHVVVATAPQHAPALLAGLPPLATTAALLGGYGYEPIATVYLGYAASTVLPKPMLGLAHTGPASLGQWAFDHGALHGRAGLIACVLSARGAWQELDNAGLAAALHGELQAALGQPLESPHWHFVVREKRATFACRPDLPRPATKSAVPGLWLAGDYVCADYPATLEGAMRSGSAAARAILASA